MAAHTNKISHAFAVARARRLVCTSNILLAPHGCPKDRSLTCTSSPTQKPTRTQPKLLPIHKPRTKSARALRAPNNNICGVCCAANYIVSPHHIHDTPNTWKPRVARRHHRCLVAPNDKRRIVPPPQHNAYHARTSFGAASAHNMETFAAARAPTCAQHIFAATIQRAALEVEHNTISTQGSLGTAIVNSKAIIYWQDTGQVIY